jgi:hypothetical protein
MCTVAGHGTRTVACFLFARSEAGTVGSNPTQGLLVAWEHFSYWILNPQSSSIQSQSHIATDSQSVSLGVEPRLRPMTRYLLL